jgi:hypothetical protein
MDYLMQLKSAFRRWLSTACEEFSCNMPGNEYFEEFSRRIPEGIQDWLGKGLSEEIILEEGFHFRLKGLASHKGPYTWFERRKDSPPSPTWEYYVQVAEYVKLFRLCSRQGLTLGFEDGLMDITVYRDGSLLVCVEVKEKAAKLDELLEGLHQYEDGIDRSVDDRGNDPLRKAKYITMYKPPFVSFVAVGVKKDFRVRYSDGKEFQLTPDSLPVI